MFIEFTLYKQLIRRVILIKPLKAPNLLVHIQSEGGKTLSEGGETLSDWVKTLSGWVKTLSDWAKTLS